MSSASTMTSVPLVLAPLAGLALMVLAHVTACQWGTTRGHLARFISTFAAALAAVSAASVFLCAGVPDAGPVDRVALVAMNAAIFASLAYGYFTFVNLTATSLRLRLLREIAAQPAGTVPTARLTGLYRTEQIIDARLERLVGWKQLTRVGSRYTVDGTPLFLRIRQAVLAWRWAVLGRTDLLADPPRATDREPR